MNEQSALITALVKAQAKMGGAKKDGDNPHFRSKYATLESVVDAIKPPLAENGLAFIQKFYNDFQDCVAVETIILHQSGEQLSNGVLVLPVSKKDAQGYGSAITYARRYSLQLAFGIAPEDDDGNAAVGGGKQQENEHKSSQSKRQAKTLDYLKKAAQSECDTPDELSAWYKDNADDIGKLSPADQKALIAHCSSLKAEMLKKQSSAPATIDCPLGGKVIREVECAECDKKDKCAHWNQ